MIDDVIIVAIYAGLMWVEIERHMEESAKKRCKILLGILCIATVITSAIH